MGIIYKGNLRMADAMEGEDIFEQMAVITKEI